MAANGQPALRRQGNRITSLDKAQKMTKEQKDERPTVNPADAKRLVSRPLHHPITFGRWLLKYAKEAWDEGALCWEYGGKYYDTGELYEEFCRQQ